MNQLELFNGDQFSDPLPELHPAIAALRGAQMSIGVRGDHVPAILKSGRFLSQHDTNTSLGTLDPDFRASTESRWGMNKPIYGVWRSPAFDEHLEDYTDRQRGGAYGEAQFNIRRSPELQAKQFATWDDSLGGAAPKPIMGEEPPTGWGGKDGGGWASWDKAGYIEAQYQPGPGEHGLPLEHVESAEVYSKYRDDSGYEQDELARTLQGAGIPTTRFDRVRFEQPNLSAWLGEGRPGIDSDHELDDRDNRRERFEESLYDLDADRVRAGHSRSSEFAKWKWSLTETTDSWRWRPQRDWKTEEDPPAPEEPRQVKTTYKRFSGAW